MYGFAQIGLSGAEAACSVHGSASRWHSRKYSRVRFSGLPRTEAGIYPERRTRTAPTPALEDVKEIIL
jgi:hypothetical protein